MGPRARRQRCTPKPKLRVRTASRRTRGSAPCAMRASAPRRAAHLVPVGNSQARCRTPSSVSAKRPAATQRHRVEQVGIEQHRGALRAPCTSRADAAMLLPLSTYSPLLETRHVERRARTASSCGDAERAFSAVACALAAFLSSPVDGADGRRAPEAERVDGACRDGARDALRRRGEARRCRRARRRRACAVGAEAVRRRLTAAVATTSSSSRFSDSRSLPAIASSTRT